MKLKPEERQYFDEHFNGNGDAIAAHDYAQMKSGHEQFLGELAPHVIAGGGGLEDIQKLRGMQNLGPLERSLLTEQWKGKAPKEDATQKAILEGIYKDIDQGYEPPVGPDGKPVSMSPLDIAIAKAKLKQQAKAAVFQPPAQAQQAVNPAANIPQTGSQLKEVLHNGVTATPEQIKKEVDSHIGSKEADENFYSNYIANPSVPLADKRRALAEFEKFVAAPPHNPNISLSEATRRQQSLRDALAAAKDAVGIDEVMQREVNPAWTDAKSQIEQKVNEFARSLGVSPQNIYNSIAKNEPIDIGNGAQPIGEVVLGKDYREPNPFVRHALDRLEQQKAKNHPIKTLLDQVTGQFDDITNNGVLNTLAQEKTRKYLEKKAGGIPLQQSTPASPPPAVTNPQLEVALQKYAPK